MAYTLPHSNKTVTRQRLLLGLTIIGFIVPNAMLAVFFVREGFDVSLYFSAWVDSLPSAQLTADLIITSLVFFIWVSWDGPRSGVRYWWVTIPATMLVGICFALPLYLLLRERVTRPESR